MRYWRKLSVFPIQLLLSHMSKPFSSKYWTLYFTRIQNDIKLGTLRMIYVLSANVNLKTMQHLFYDCSYSITFWKDFESYFLSLTQQQIHLNLKDIFIGLLTPELPLLNYLIHIGKIYLWACRRNKELPSIRGFKSKVKLKYETEKYICTKNNNLDMFRKKWAI